MEEYIKNVIKNLENNNMDVQFFEDKIGALNYVKALLKSKDKIAVGGSVTLRETGIQWYIEDGDFEYTNRYRKGTFDFDETVSKDIIQKSYYDGFYADYYFTSSNAVTEDGKLFNIDGQGNRVAAMIYGPINVVVVVGKNKIVKDFDAAFERLKNVVCPKNNIRHKNSVPCTVTGKCIECKSIQRSCCDYVLMGYQKIKGRIKIILINEDLGY